jgi:hypothetical protein
VEKTTTTTTTTKNRCNPWLVVPSSFPEQIIQNSFIIHWLLNQKPVSKTTKKSRNTALTQDHSAWGSCHVSQNHAWLGLDSPHSILACHRIHIDAEAAY